MSAFKKSKLCHSSYIYIRRQSIATINEHFFLHTTKYAEAHHQSSPWDARTSQDWRSTSTNRNHVQLALFVKYYLKRNKRIVSCHKYIRSRVFGFLTIKFKFQQSLLDCL